MKKTLAASFAALVVCSAAFSSLSFDGSHSRDLIIVAGQSNADGPMADAAILTEVPDGKLWLGDGHQGWIRLAAQDGHFGPEMGMAQVIPEPSIFKFAIGSTSLAEDWRPAEKDGLLAKMMSSLEMAKGDLTPSCFVFVQGESDAKTPEFAASYPERLDRLIQELRRKFSGIPIVLSVDELHPWFHDKPQIVDAQKTMATDPLVEFVSFADLEKADQTHLTAPATLEQGRRFAHACQEMSAGES